MKYVYFLLILAFAAIPFFLFGQNTTERELDKIATEFVVKMRSKKEVKKVVLQDFTLGNKNSKLGKYLTEDFNVALDLIGNLPFELIKPDKTSSTRDTSGGVRLSTLADAANQTANTMSRVNPNGKVNDQLRATGEVLGAIGHLKNVKIGSKTEKPKFDAIIKGDLTNDEASEQIRLIIKVFDNENKQIEIHRGYITKTPSILEMVKASPPVGGGGTDGNALQIFKKDNLIFALKELKQIGNTLECDFDIINEGREDIELYIYDENSRAINKEGGYEYGVSSLKISEKSNSNQINKTIVAGSNFPAKIIFSNVRETVTDLSKINIKCWGTAIGWFIVDFTEIGVNQ
jgi:hypothetical protein